MPTEISSFTRARRRKPPEDADSVDLRGLTRTIWHYRWITLMCMVGVAVLTWVAVKQITPTYTALSKVMLDPRKAQIITNEEVVQDLDLTEQIVNGEAAVLRSNVLIEKTIANIGIEALAPMVPEADEAVQEAKASGDAEAVERAEAARIESLVWAIRKNLVVYREGESYVIGIRVDNQDPKLAAAIANNLVDTYIAEQLKNRREAARRATDWLGDSVDEMRAEVEKAEADVAKYRAESLVVDGGTMDTATQQLADLSAQLIKASADTAAAEALVQQLQTVFDRGGYQAAAKIVTSPLIEQFNEERIELVRQDDNWSERYDENHIERVRLKAKLNRLDADIEAEVQKIISLRKNELEIARIRETTLRDGISKLEDRILSISRNALGLRQLEREAAATRENYENLLERLTETRTQERLQEPDAKLIERATIPGAPSAPRPKLLAVLGGMAGGIFGLGFILFLEMTAHTFKTARDLEAETGLPVLASIPVQNWGKGGLMAATRTLRDDPYSLYGERIRHLRTALLMRDGGEKSRSIMLMSTTPNEGKTTTTLALAEMSVLAGKSVIVVDCDLRRSTMQKAFAWDIDNDLSDFIRGDCRLDQAIFSDPEFGFDFLAARGAHPDVADKLSANWLEPVVKELKRVYDVVLIDAPAMLAVSDALVLAPVVDTRVFLVHWGETPRRAVSEGLDALQEMGLGVTGMVLTMVDPSKSAEPNIEGYSYDA